MKKGMKKQAGPAKPKPSKLRTGDSVQTGELEKIRQDLDLICSCVIVVRHALSEQNADLDEDAALVLKRHVSDPLFEQVVRIDRLLGDKNEAEGLS